MTATLTESGESGESGETGETAGAGVPGTTGDGTKSRPSPPHRPRFRILGAYLVTVFVLLNLNFFLPRTLPGDPIDALLTQGAANDPAGETRAALEAYYGLDRPLTEQYVDYFANLAQGDLGRSVLSRRAVSELISERMWWTVLLVGTSVAVATAIGVVGGIQAGWRRGRRHDKGLLGLFIGLQNIPGFFLASVVLFVFAFELGWFPSSGARTPFADFDSGLTTVADVAHHLVLPAGVLVVGLLAGPFLLMRAGMVSELGAGYLLMGRAKGMPERRLKYRYAARNALLPVVTATAYELGLAVTLVVFVERVFAYPGLGELVADAAANRDYPTLQGCFLVITLAVVTFNFLADALNARLDPRTTA